MLRGFAQGAQVGESLRQGEQRAAAEAQNAAQFNAELSARQQRAQQEYEFKAAEQQEKVKAAARHLIGMQKYQSLIQAGVPKITAMIEASADLFYDRPHELPNAMHQLAQEEAEVKRAEALENYRNKSLKLREDQAKLTQDKSIQHAGNKIVQIMPDKTVKVLFDATDIDPLDKMELTQAFRDLNMARVQSSRQTLQPDERDAYKALADKAEGVISKFRSKKPDDTSVMGALVRSKKTGKTFRYKGKLEDIPKDIYDLIE